MVRDLKGRNKIGFTDGTVPKPTNDPVKESNMSVLMLLLVPRFLGLSPKIYMQIMYFLECP